MRALLVSSLLLGSCTFDFDEVGPHAAGGGASGGGTAEGAGGSSTTTGAGGDGGAVECIGCLSLPQDFGGPYVVKANGDACSPVISGGVNGDPVILPPAGAACGCRCVAAEDPCAVLALSGTPGCNSTSATILAPDGVCTTLPGSTMGVRPLAAAGNIECQSDGGEAVVPPLVFASPIDLCEGPVSPTCGDELCIPAGRSVCVAGKLGAVCPAEFPVEFEIVRTEDFEDLRNCVCGCGTGTVQCAPPTIELFKGAGCSAAYTETTTNGCVSAAGGGVIATARMSYEAVAECAQQSVPTGSVTLLEDSGLQVCCTEEAP